MTFELSGVVPWGRSWADYRRMFALTVADLRRRLLGCADGPAGIDAFPAQVSRHAEPVGDSLRRQGGEASIE